MERYITKDNLVVKYVHDDGSETAIKDVPSCDNSIDLSTGFILPKEVNRNKFSVFISSSVGCPIGCKHCYLTVKNYPYKKLSPGMVIRNTTEAIRDCVSLKPELRKKYVKVSFMGMGDALLVNSSILKSTIEVLVDTLIEDGMCAGIDSIDIGTTLPKNDRLIGYNLSMLQSWILREYGDYINPMKRKGQSVVRLFYSLHSSIKRGELIPKLGSVKTLSNAFSTLKSLSAHNIDTIIHMVLLSGFNDNRVEMHVLRGYLDEYCIDPEIRILRYNECKNSTFEETVNFNGMVKLYSENFNKVKYQVSAGSEIKAACGQFICKSIGEL